MVRRLLEIAAVFCVTLFGVAAPAAAQTKHVALVIGNSAYQAAPQLKTPATDASIVSETLRAAGYDVTDVRDVKQADIGQVMRTFLDKVEAAGPDTVAFVYYSGHGAQSGGQNYLVPIDAVINTDDDVPEEAFRLNGLLEALADLPAVARIVVLDASRDHKFGSTGKRPVPQGLAMGDAVNGALLAFAAAPGAIAEDGDQAYSLYTGALVTMMRQPGLDLDQIFKATRLQVNKDTDGAQTPWMVSSLAAQVSLFEANAAAPEPTTIPDTSTPIPPKEDRVVSKDALRALSADAAYDLAVEQDTLEAYQWFVELFPDSALAAQVWDIIKTRREAVLWRRALAQNTTRAYWNYLKRYPDGEYATEAQGELADLSAPTTPPDSYDPVAEPLPPDYSDEAVDLPEVVPEGVDAPPPVFGAVVPVFVPHGPRDFRDHRRNRDRDRDRRRDRRRDHPVKKIPNIKGEPSKKTKLRDSKTNKADHQTGIKGVHRIDRNVRPTDRIRNIDRSIRPTDRGVHPTDRAVRGPKAGVGLPPKGTTGPRPITRGPTGVPPTTRGPAGVSPTTRGPTGLPPTTRGPAIAHPGLPPVPGTAPLKPTVPRTGVPNVGQKPGLPPIAHPVRPTTPPTVTQVRPTTPPTLRPTTPPTAHPVRATTPPTVRPSTPPAAHAVKPSAPPPARRTTPPAAHPVRPTPPPAAHTVRPTTRPVVRPTTRPTPTVRPTPQRPAVRPAAPPRPVVRPAAPPRPVMRPAAPPRPVMRAPPPARPAPPPRAPVCSVVGGKRVCR